MSRILGAIAEKQARAYLIQQGLQWIMSNYHCRLGEIDLIMRDRGYLIFVEVRARRSDLFGGAMASITYRKQQKLLKTAQFYLLHHQQFHQEAIRFDVLSIEGYPPKIIWIKHAFEAET